MKIALVHDYLVQYGGAERVLECFTEIYPEAHIYTIMHDKKLMHGVFDDRKIHTSFLQNFPLARKKHRIFPLLMPSAIEQFDFSKYEVVLSDSSSYAKGIITSPDTLHICYMHTPMRYAWDDCQKYTDDFGLPSFIKKLVPFFMSYIRLWDWASAHRVDKFIANSDFVAKRIRKYYNKKAVVINPPVNIENFYVEEDANKRGDYFLMVGRLITYKRHDIAIKAFNKLGLPLKIIGRGPEMKKLRKMAKENIEFLGRVEDADLPKYYANCRAFIFPQEEDFGIVAIEAMAAGRPLLAYRGGDIVEHLEEGRTGLFMESQTVSEVVRVIGEFEDKKFDGRYIRGKALKFDKAVFKERIKIFVAEALKEYRRN
ncbi:MAG: glycosyltransferase [Candidatus Moraniibacteriota bacterium]